MTYAPTEDWIVPADDSVVVPEGGNAQPLPDGTKVLVTILPTRKDGSSIEKRPFSKDANNPNSRITALAVRTAIVAGQRGAGRNIFATIPMARKFASGKTVFSFYGFFRALGYDVDGEFRYPGDHAIMGQQFEAVLGVETDDKGEERNNIKFFNKPNGIPAQSAVTAAPRAAQAPAWTPPAAGAAAPASAAPAAAAPPQGQPPAWLPAGAQPAAPVDPAVAEAAASGASY